MYVNGTDNFLKYAKTNQLVNGCHEKFSWKVWVRQMRDPLYKKLNLDAELMKQFKGKYCKFVFFNFKKNLVEGGLYSYTLFFCYVPQFSPNCFPRIQQNDHSIKDYFSCFYSDTRTAKRNQENKERINCSYYIVMMAPKGYDKSPEVCDFS